MYDICKAYRIGKRKPFPTSRNKHRSILVSFSDSRHTEIILKNATRLKGTTFGISRDYPVEISEARQELWPDFKVAREKYGPRRVSIKYSASLVINGDTVKDMFPDWHQLLNGSRHFDVREQIDEQVKALASEALKSYQATTNTDTADSDQESEMEKTIPLNLKQNVTVASKENIKRLAPSSQKWNARH